MVTYYFNHWEINGQTSTVNPIRLVINKDLKVTAVYSTTPTPPAPCFIATAAYGTPLAPELNILREFRNRCLPKSIVNLYYSLSPPIAEYIHRHMNVRRMVREVLSVVVNILRRS